MRRRKRKNAEKKGKVEMRILYIPMQYLKYPTRSKIKKKKQNFISTVEKFDAI